MCVRVMRECFVMEREWWSAEMRRSIWGVARGWRFGLGGEEEGRRRSSHDAWAPVGRATRARGMAVSMSGELFLLCLKEGFMS